MDKFRGKVALITGAARSQGRSHALALAREGADIVVCDARPRLTAMPYPLASREDLDTTAALVGREGGRCVALEADVRDQSCVFDVVGQALEAFGRASTFASPTPRSIPMD